MPKRKARKKVVRRKRKVVRRKNIQGEGPVGDWLKRLLVKKNVKKANKFLRKNKVISRTAGILDEFGVPHASRVARVSKKLGYGKRGTNQRHEPRAIKV